MITYLTKEVVNGITVEISLIIDEKLQFAASATKEDVEIHFYKEQEKTDDLVLTNLEGEVKVGEKHWSMTLDKIDVNTAREKMLELINLILSERHKENNDRQSD